MREATIKMDKIINDQNIVTPNYKIISNVTAKEYQSTEEIKNLLVKQIESPVRWRESIEFMIFSGTNTLLRLALGKY